MKNRVMSTLTEYSSEK